MDGRGKAETLIEGESKIRICANNSSSGLETECIPLWHTIIISGFQEAKCSISEQIVYICDGHIIFVDSVT